MIWQVALGVLEIITDVNISEPVGSKNRSSEMRGMLSLQAIQKFLQEFPELWRDSDEWNGGTEIKVVGARELERQLNREQFRSPTWDGCGYTYGGAGYALFESEYEFKVAQFEYNKQLPLRLFQDIFGACPADGLWLKRFILRYHTPNGLFKGYHVFRDNQSHKLREVMRQYLEKHGR